MKYYLLMIDIGFSGCRNCHILVGKYSITWRFFRGHFVVCSFKISCAPRRHQSIPEDVLALGSVSSTNSRTLPVFRVTQSRSLRQFRGLIVDRCVIPFGSLGCNSLRSGGAVQAGISRKLSRRRKLTTRKHAYLMLMLPFANDLPTFDWSILDVDSWSFLFAIRFISLTFIVKARNLFSTLYWATDNEKVTGRGVVIILFDSKSNQSTNSERNLRLKRGKWYNKTNKDTYFLSDFPRVN